jgi:hypothetical protein
MKPTDKSLPRTAWKDLSDEHRVEILGLFKDPEVLAHPERFGFERDARGRWGCAPVDDLTALWMALRAGSKRGLL